MGFDPLKGGISLPPNSDDFAGERGRTDGDRRHRLVVSGNLGLPWFGLRASGVVQLATGLPFNVTTGTDDNLDGVLSERPEGVGRNTGEDTPLDPVNLLREERNKALFAIDPSAELLSMITSLNEPNFAQVDVRLYRSFLYDEGRGRGQVFLQVINLLDRENAGLIEGRALSQSFGRTISLAGPPRIVEFGIKFGH